MEDNSRPKDRTPLPSGVVSIHTQTRPVRPTIDRGDLGSRKNGAPERVMGVTQATGETLNIVDLEKREVSREAHDSPQKIGPSTHVDSDSKKRKHSGVQSTTINRPVLGLFPRFTSGNYVDQRPQRPPMTVKRKQTCPPSINAHQYPRQEMANGIRSFDAKQPPLKPMYYPSIPPVDDGHIESKCDELFVKIECYARALRGIEIDLSELKTTVKINERLSETAEVPTCTNPLRHIFYVEPEKRKLFTAKPALTETLRELFNVRPDRTVCQELDTLSPGLHNLTYETLICSCHAFLLGRLARQEYDGSVDSGGVLKHTLEIVFSGGIDHFLREYHTRLLQTPSSRKEIDLKAKSMSKTIGDSLAVLTKLVGEETEALALRRLDIVRLMLDLAARLHTQVGRKFDYIWPLANEPFDPVVHMLDRSDATLKDFKATAKLQKIGLTKMFGICVVVGNEPPRVISKAVVVLQKPYIQSQTRSK